jgi:hypothetical protein
MVKCEWQCKANSCYYATNLRMVLEDLKKIEYQDPNWFSSVQDQLNLAKQHSCQNPILIILISQGENALKNAKFLNMLNNL